MDLRYSELEATPEEKHVVNEVVGRPESGWQGGERHIKTEGHVAFGGQTSRSQRHLLLPALWAIQARFGWVPPGAFNYLCRRLTVPPAEAYGVASFYGLFSLSPRPSHVLHVCDDIACQISGAEALCEKLERVVGEAGIANPTGHVTWLRSPCLGLCERAPAALLSVSGERPREAVLAPASDKTLLAAAADGVQPAPPSTPRDSVPQAGQADLRLLKRIGEVDPADIDQYRSQGGYLALRQSLELGAEGTIREIIDSRLVGRGGAAFPTGKKWEAVAHAAQRPHYLVCNADESEPGTFKDRILMEGDPFALVEAMTIAGVATGCEKGFLYIRGEYPLATERLKHATEVARSRDLLGANILGQGVSFDIEIRRGAGAYICGEETALFNSIEGYRGEPRNKPPYPTQVGLFGSPTLVNNVETLVNVLEILREGGTAYAGRGTDRSTGTKLFCVCGHVKRPGVYEVLFGTTLRELIDLAGGVAGSGKLKAVLLGGAAGTFLSPKELDTPLSFEGARKVGASLGSGVVMLFDHTVDLKRTLLRIAAFFRDESCGQCVPCRVGTVRQEELLHRLIHGTPLESAQSELGLLKELGQVMRDASICGLGQTASAAVESALSRWNLFDQEPKRR
ncbi:MAG: NAD(P)H-dependent oxidoreductase subunit E [Acidobacteriota bacterium]